MHCTVSLVEKQLCRFHSFPNGTQIMQLRFLSQRIQTVELGHDNALGVLGSSILWALRT